MEPSQETNVQISGNAKAEVDINEAFSKEDVGERFFAALWLGSGILGLAVLGVFAASSQDRLMNFFLDNEDALLKKQTQESDAKVKMQEQELETKILKEKNKCLEARLEDMKNSEAKE